LRLIFQFFLPDQVSCKYQTGVSSVINRVYGRDLTFGQAGAYTHTLFGIFKQNKNPRYSRVFLLVLKGIITPAEARGKRIFRL